MKSITLIVPYFGKLPNYFQLLLNSISYSKLCDLIVFTDDSSEFEIPDNVRIHKMKFNDLKDLVKENIGDVFLENPYKLADYKPCYGAIFQDYLEESEYWGYCDLDIIFGDLDKYLKKIQFEKYDRIFNYGHLSIYRNEKFMNQLFKYKDKSLPKMMQFDYVKKTSYPCHLDEIGMNHITKHSNKKFYNNFFSLNTHHFYPQLTHNAGNGCVAVFDEGKLVVYDKDNTCDEYIYFHLQGKGNLPINCDLDSHKFIVHENGFFPFTRLDQLNDYRIDYSEENQNIYLDKLLRERRKKKRDRLIYEFSHFPIRGIYNIVLRILAVKYENKYPLNYKENVQD